MPSKTPPAPQYKVTFSLVVYKQPVGKLSEAIRSLMRCPAPKRIYVIDNSPTDEARPAPDADGCVEYCHMPGNIGFSEAHNLAFHKAMAAGSRYHFVVNPDIRADEDVVTPMVEWLDAHPDVGQMMPKILNPDGSTQFLPKLMPSPWMLLCRRLGRLPLRSVSRCLSNFEMREMRDDRVYDVGHITGSFSVVRMDVLRQVGYYDKRFFLYFEDTDLTRRILTHSRAVYFPMVSVYHEYGHGAARNPKLFLVFVASLIKFFNKWGWFSDARREEYNRRILGQFRPAGK